jgi:two-component system, OmpR family, sensor kinase
MRVRARLALRIYLTGLAQFAAVLLGFVLLISFDFRRARLVERDARAAVDEVIAHLGDTKALEREFDRIEHTVEATIEIYDDGGHVLATNRRPGDRDRRALQEPLPFIPGLPPLPPPSAALGPPPVLPEGPLVPAYVIPVQLPDGRIGRAIYGARDRRPPANTYVVIAFVLIVIGLASFWTSRSLAKPLTLLSRAAQRFGAGDLETRLRLRRADEIGDVARAFDDMANRITDLLRAERELIANVSHELRTPLARIRVALDLAGEGADISGPLLEDITLDLAELEQLISDILVASRLDLAKVSTSTTDGVPPLHREGIEIADVVGKAAALFRSAHPDRALAVSSADMRASVEGDPVLLRRALQNLLENAHKYTSHPEGAIELESGLQANEVWIEVRDQGIGIAPGDLPHVFRPFFRADRSRTRATGGVGLGLALVKRIVEAHRGTVEMQSELGTGTRVRVRLPRAI